MPVFAEMLAEYRLVLDPFAGTGRIHELRDRGHVTFGVELEPEWARLSEFTLIGNALDLPFADDTFDAICTSPTYGNRLADHHNAQDGSTRRSYTHDLGRPLTEQNSGQMHWGDDYRDFHRAAYTEATRVLRPGGRFVLNMKDHVRKGVRQYVTRWHIETLMALGLVIADERSVATRHLAIGSTGHARAGSEMVVTFDVNRGAA